MILMCGTCARGRLHLESCGFGGLPDTGLLYPCTGCWLKMAEKPEDLSLPASVVARIIKDAVSTIDIRGRERD